ncbi:hypothetical protein [Microbacterium sp. SLBN-146]|uniref:hypothetical protein n=1 Tax=Microbacterium sp. SLBN-146 TaxID=2768457 RepID=UPI001151A044|nr:hypothetical protein [Microbacterium sp. SLBN-146]
MPGEEQRVESQAQVDVAELVRAMDGRLIDDINGWARSAVAKAQSMPFGFPHIDLIRIAALEATELIDPVGQLDFRVNPTENPYGEAIAHCYRVAFDYYGKVGEWSTSDGVEPIDCPADAAPVTPPPDTRIVEVVVDNAQDVIHAVLLERIQTGSPASESDIAATIVSRLDTPTGEYEVAAAPRVLIDSSSGKERVGVAMGQGYDCTLVKSEDGVVTDVHAPIELVQPGEYGCNPDTALLSADQLRPSH